MAVATLTSKGQTTIPKEIRERLGLSPGDKLDFVVEEDGRVVLRPATLHVSELKGLLRGKKGKPVSLEQMDRAIAEGAMRARK
ncbi:MAG TPA: AbrB/MazE/SpoVT family DNA-binding domain-containing protein [Burkholderiales bacterium]|nr:AbrB/MazE/SpoVT family DNA-binding domain-containing protein [Burkholderiales bacterium]